MKWNVLVYYTKANVGIVTGDYRRIRVFISENEDQIPIACVYDTGSIIKEKSEECLLAFTKLFSLSKNESLLIIKHQNSFIRYIAKQKIKGREFFIKYGAGHDDYFHTEHDWPQERWIKAEQHPDYLYKLALEYDKISK